MYTLGNILIRMINTLQLLIFIRAILSWFLPPQHSISRIIAILTEPLLHPIREFLQRFQRNSMIDFSIIVAFLFLRIIEILIYRVL